MKRSFAKGGAVLAAAVTVAGGLTLLAQAAAPQAPVPTAAVSGPYNVRAFGAKGDGTTLDTPAIQKAIDAAADAGGGTVLLPAGTYLSVSLHLKSNITLYFDQGATLLAAGPTNGPAYDAPEDNPAGKNYQDFGHSHWRNSLIWGENLENISLLGPGRIWGKGLVRSNNSADGRGNKAISLKLCRNVIIRDVTIQHGGWFGILATGVDNLTIDNVKMDTNRDGMDIDCCRQVRISNCSINSPFDDAICLKSSFGLGFARATENVTITNCQVSGYDEGSFLDGTYKRTVKYDNGPTGRIKFGTESNGGFKNITISNCVFEYCRGLALESVDGALLEDVTITNITMRDIVNAPIFLRLGRRMRGPDNVPVGTLRRVSLSNFVIYGGGRQQGCLLTGIPNHPLEDVRLSNIHLYTHGGGTTEQATRVVPEDEKAYPEPGRFGDMPAYGFFIRHVRGLEMNNVSTHWVEPDKRPALLLDDVHGADLQQIAAQHADGIKTMSLNNVRDLRVRNSRGLPDTERARVEKGNL